MPQDIITFGCRLNTYESEVIRDALAQTGQPNVAVFNTCAVTKEAERQARQAIRKYHREHPEAKIVITGCAAQIHPEQFAAIDGVTLVLGNEEKLKAQSYQELAPKSDNAAPPIRVTNIMAVKETAGHLVTSFEDRARAFLQVQNGCNHRCTFCIIPYGRGNSRSVALGEVVTQAQTLVREGYHELVLTGVDLTAYGEDLPGTPTLGEMLRRLLRLVPDLPRIRLSSIDVAEIDPVLWDLIEHEPRLMPHFHLSLQAGDNMILKRMKRRHT
ncbi:MAG: radical SAM protein, partial [Rickettsiales bacterium]|nr:radical SAM protein [Rickettsiales bacterium]